MWRRLGGISRCNLVTSTSCCSARVSEQLRYWRCCIHLLPSLRHGKSGGCLELVTARTTHLQMSHATWSKRYRMAKASLDTAVPAPTIVWEWTLMLRDVSESTCSKNLVCRATPISICAGLLRFCRI